METSVFDGPQIRKLIKVENFLLSMTEVEKDAWDAFAKVTQNFLGNKTAHSYIQLLIDLLEKFHKFNINMSIKVHFLFSHLDSFPENVGDYLFGVLC